MIEQAEIKRVGKESGERAHAERVIRFGTPPSIEHTNDTTGGHVACEFDDMDRLESITWKDDQGGTVRSFDYAYNAAGMVTNITLESGEQLAYTYDSLQRLTSEKRLSSTGATLREESFTYDKVGNRTTKVLDGTTVTYSYPSGSQGNRLASWSASSTDNIEVGRLWDVAGHSSETIGTNDRYGVLSVSNTVAVTPEYSGTNYTAAAFPIGSGIQEVVAAIRDDAGNMGYATNTVTTRIITNGVYGYSAAGCVTSIVYTGISYPGKAAGLEWNGQYQLTAVRENGSLAECYGYDALGRRAWISDGSTTNWMVYDGQHLAVEVDSNGNLLRRYILGPGIDNALGMASYEGGQTNAYFFVTDHLGTVHAVLDDNGAEVESYEFDAWGRVIAVRDANGSVLAQSAIGNRILFQGREYSWASGLYFFRARYYDPVLGRWLSKDPIGIAGGLNQYVFCGNNPVNFRDPFGLWSFYRWLYTGNGNASDAVYNSAVDAAADYIFNHGGVRGGYIGVGVSKKAPGRGAIAGMGGVRANWTIDQGLGGTVDFGVGLQERGATRVLGLGTMPFISEAVGVGGSYDLYSEDCGWKNPKEGFVPGIYGGAANRRGGGHFAINSVNNAAIGLNYGPVYFGLLIDPERVLQNFVDSYHVLRGDF